MRCPNCGNENPPDYMFCDECGARLTGVDQAADTADSSASGDGGASASSSGGSDIMGLAGTPSASSATMSSGSSSGSDVDTGSNMNMSGGMGASGESMDSGDSSAASAEPTPVTEDTMPAATPSYSYDAMSGGPADSGGSDAGAAAMPDVTPMTPVSSSPSGADEADTFEAVPVEAHGTNDWTATSSTTDSGDQGQGVTMGSAAAGGTAAGMADASGGAAASGGGVAWATEALKQLETAQKAMMAGDWGGFGQAMSTLKSTLEGAASGAGSAAVQPMLPSMGAATTSSPATSTASTPASYGSSLDSGSATGAGWGGTTTDNGASAPTAPSYVSTGSQPSPQASSEAGAGAGGIASMPSSSTSVGEATEAAPSAAPAPMGVADASEVGMARLVVISTGAELSLPEQEEITVGREDPSSGIFPDVDLTPYGGEDGGVSRRHARLLHIGDDYFVEDLQSTNYTKLDGQRLPAHVRERLEDGARLDFGRVAVIFRRS